MIIELLGVPGSGKTTIAENYQLENSHEIFLIAGNNSTPFFDKKKGLKSTFIWILIKTMRVLSFIMLPWALYFFRSSVWELLRQARSKRVSNVSNFKFIPLYLLSLSYQVMRYTLGIFIKFFTSKTIFIDEGLIYNMIRIRTFLSPDCAKKVWNKYSQELVKFNVYGIWLKTDPIVSMHRFKEREQKTDFKRGSMSIFKHWKIERTKPDWMAGAWKEFDQWHSDLVTIFPSIISIIDLESSQSDLASKISDCLKGSEKK